MKTKKATKRLDHAAELLGSVIDGLDAAPGEAVTLLRTASQALERARVQIEETGDKPKKSKTNPAPAARSQKKAKAAKDQ
jgi:hypothetical protein